MPIIFCLRRPLDAVFLESNYDFDMLVTGSYPEFLKARIQGPGGHLSNLEAAKLLFDAARKNLRFACLAHLSGDNNYPELALKTHRRVLGEWFPLHVATRDGATDMMEV